MESKLETLRRIALFATLSDDALSHIAQVAIPRAHGPGEMIILEGEPFCRIQAPTFRLHWSRKVGAF
jgi:hypothetical protein